MRIAYDTPTAPVAPKAKGPGSPRDTGANESGDTFAALLAVAGLSATATPSTTEASTAPSARDAGDSTNDTAEPTTVTEPAGDETAAAAAATAVMASLFNLTGSPLEVTCAIEAGPTADPASSLPSLGESGAIAIADLPPMPDQAGTAAADAADVAGAVRDALATAEATTADPDAPTGAAASASTTATTAGPTTTPAVSSTLASAPVDTSTLADLNATSVTVTATATADEPSSTVAPRLTTTDTADATTPADRTAAAGSLTTLRTTAPATVGATEHPIAPTRLSEVLLAATRASVEADRPVRLTVRLDPPNLGEVRVELLARNGTVTVRVEPIHETAAPLLSQQRQAVSDALERTGFTMTSFDVAPGNQQRERATPTKRTVRVAEATATDDALEPTPTDEPGRRSLRI